MTARWPDGYGRLVLDEVDSTNAEALRRMPDLAGPLWIMARRQLAGRGRRGRAWSDPPGNLAATLAMRTGEPPARLALRSFLAALALDEALEALTGLEGAFALKWPNDVLIEGGKLSGILLESAEEGALALGVGVNLRTTPPADPGAAHPPISLRAATGFDIAPEALFDALAAHYAEWESRFAAQGFAPARRAFLARVARLGEQVVARTPREAYCGVFETIDESGALVLARPEGRLVLPAADIFFP
ncbi:MAG: biotin--[acetyl-CoA-carboxylase] ligase [Pararhodobacter sp.]|nr:biotin--[acetyl-CoA-carboxylase] ligase [Pararhodobacter sp.]